MLTMKLKIKDVEVEMTMDELRELYKDLAVIFNQKQEITWSPYILPPRAPWESPAIKGGSTS